MPGSVDAEMDSALKPLRISRSWRSVLPNLIFAFVAAGLVLYFSLEYDFFGFTLDFTFFGKKITAVFPLFLLVLGVLLARPVFLMKDTKHILASHHLYSESGRLSLHRQHVEIAFEKMLGVRFQQNLIERALNVGSVLVWTASADRPEVVLKGIKDPEVITRTIQQRIDEIIMQKDRLHGLHT